MKWNAKYLGILSVQTRAINTSIQSQTKWLKKLKNACDKLENNDILIFC